MQHRPPVSEAAIRDTMAAVFRQAAFVKRQPTWIARKIGDFFDWLGSVLQGLSGTQLVTQDRARPASTVRLVWPEVRV